MRFGSVLVVITQYCYIVKLKQSDRMLSAILILSYKHHLDYQMSVVL